MKYKPLALAAAALAAGMIGFSSAQAASVMTAGAPAPITKMQNLPVETVSHRHHHSRFYFGFGLPFFSPFYSPYYYRPYYQPYYYQPYYAPRYYYRPVSSSRHVRWCLDRYRTYNPRTNTFRGYDGYLHRCRSPYRY